MEEELFDHGVESDPVRRADLKLLPGISTEGEGDEWPASTRSCWSPRSLCSPRPPGSGARPARPAGARADGRDALRDRRRGRPVAYNRVAGLVVTGNEDGAHHVISEVSAGLIDIGYTVPGQAWTYWNRGPGPGPSYLRPTTDEHEWSETTTGKTAAQNIAAVGRGPPGRPDPRAPAARLSAVQGSTPTAAGWGGRGAARVGDPLSFRAPSAAAVRSSVRKPPHGLRFPRSRLRRDVEPTGRNWGPTVSVPLDSAAPRPLPHVPMPPPAPASPATPSAPAKARPALQSASSAAPTGVGPSSTSNVTPTVFAAPSASSSTSATSSRGISP